MCGNCCPNINDNRSTKRSFNRRLETKIIGKDFEEVDSYFAHVSKSICKIRTSITLASGFLLKYFIDNKFFFCLVSNAHVIKKEMIENKEKIFVSYNNENNNIECQLNKEERYIKCFKEKENKEDEDMGMVIDITVVEILSKDNIYEDYFLTPELNVNVNQIKGKEIYIPQYPLGKKIMNARGIILEINNYEMIYNACTEGGSSGSPIFLANTTKVIGIHKEGGQDKRKNYGNFIYPIFNILKNEIRQKNIFKINKYSKPQDNFELTDDLKRNILNQMFKREEKTIVYPGVGKYIGETKNGLKEGVGLLQFDNGETYEGECKNNKADGNGTYTWPDGDKFIGEYKNDKKNGRGVYFYNKPPFTGDRYEGNYKDNIKEGYGAYYYNNGDKYIGEFKNNAFEGKGIFYYNNGDKYEGDFKNGLRHGKGILVLTNGMIYEGDFKNNELDGKGKLKYNNGDKYIGDFKRNIREGKGIMTRTDGIRYEGDYKQNSPEGKGKIYINNILYYEGDFKNNKPEGKGIFYLPSGTIYEGELKRGKTNGKGTMYFENGDKQVGNFVNNIPTGKHFYYHDNGKIEIKKY